jgi:hypothetical protein
LSGPGATDLLGDFGSAADDFNPRGFDSSSTAPAANGMHENIIILSLCVLRFYYPMLFLLVICDLSALVAAGGANANGDFGDFSQFQSAQPQLR